MSSAHVKHGFLAAVYEPWVSFEGSEWGDCMSLLWQAYERAYIWSDEELDILEKILRDHLEAVWPDFEADEAYAEDVYRSRCYYDDTVKNWRQRARGQGFDDEPLFIAVERSVPDWMRPPTSEERRDRDRKELEEKREWHLGQLHDVNVKLGSHQA